MVQLGNEKEEQHANANKKERRSVEIKKKRYVGSSILFFLRTARALQRVHTV